MKNIYFLHGMESSPKGTKAQLLKKHYPGCIIPHLPPDLKERDKILNDLITSPSWLIGSSLGGLSALFFAMEKPDLVKEMVLLAPAVGFFDPQLFSVEEQDRIYSTYIPDEINCTIFAGTRDDVIPMESILDLISRSPSHSGITLHKLDDDHSLNRYPEKLLESVQKMIDLSGGS